MRQHKYKVYHPELGLSQPFLLTVKNILVSFDGYSSWRDLSHLPRGAVFLEWTGLKDKKVVEIYEGDICRFYIQCSQEPNDPRASESHKIVWMDSGWGFEPIFPDLLHPDDKETKAFYVDPFEGDDWDSTEYFEVIGNIHENPELLEK